MTNIPLPKCSQSLNHILGYLAWKRFRIKAFSGSAKYDRLLGENGFLTSGDRELNNFYWKEIYWLITHRNDCKINERYHYFDLNEKFNNESFSYTAEERNDYTGLMETVTYQIVPTNGSIESTIISSLEKTIKANFDEYVMSGASSISELQDSRPAPLPLRVWTITKPTAITGKNAVYQIPGRLISKQPGQFTLEQPSTVTNDEIVTFKKITRTHSTDHIRDDITYINNTNDFTYNQSISQIILYEEYIGSTFKTNKIEEKSSLVRLYTYKYIDFQNRYDLAQAAEKKQYVWDDLSQRKASVTTVRPTYWSNENRISSVDYLTVRARVRRTTSDGCTSIYSMPIGRVKTTIYYCNYYTLPRTNSKQFEPKDINTNLKDHCSKTELFNSILDNNYDPFSTDFRNAMNSILPFNGNVFGEDGADTLLDIVKKPVNIAKNEPLPPASFSDCGTSANGSADVSEENGWEVIKYIQ